MASGERVVSIHQRNPLTSSNATPAVILGTSTPPERTVVWEFDSGANEYLDFLGWLNGYDAGGLTFALAYTKDNTTGTITWSLAIRYLEDDHADSLLTANHTANYSYQTGSGPPPSAAGEVRYSEIAFTAGQIDGWANNKAALLRLRRTDSAGGIARLVGLPMGRET